MQGVVAAREVPSSVDKGPALKYWEKKLPGVAVPAPLRAAVSPVEGSALADLFATHIQHGAFYPSTSASFCKMARLVCDDETLHSGHHHQLDVAANGYKGDKDAYGYKGDKDAYGYKGDKDAYGYKGDKDAYGYKGDKDAYGYKGDKDAYGYKGDKDAYGYKVDKKPSSNYKIGEPSTPSNGFFLETDVAVGVTLRLREQPPMPIKSFVPRVVADVLPPMMPDSLVKLQRIFNIDEGTEMYDSLDFITTVCDNSTVLDGEERVCLASLESYVDFLSSHVGPDVQVLTSSPRPRIIMGPVTITNFSLHHSEEDNLSVLVCHILNFPAQMYMCHSVPDSKVIEATVTDVDGVEMQATGICHLDTKMWYPGHQSFRILGTQPGIPVCHWNGPEAMVWYSTKIEETSVVKEAVAHGGHMAMDKKSGHDHMGM
jgi:hypothetical protein